MYSQMKPPPVEASCDQEQYFSGQLDIYSQTCLGQIVSSPVVSLIHQIDGVRICINWSGENIVHITFLYIVCKNM